MNPNSDAIRVMISACIGKLCDDLIIAPYFWDGLRGLDPIARRRGSGPRVPPDLREMHQPFDQPASIEQKKKFWDFAAKNTDWPRGPWRKSPEI